VTADITIHSVSKSREIITVRLATIKQQPVESGQAHSKHR